MLRWFGVGEGDEVIVPAYTYCATANVVLHLGAKPILVDVNRDDFNISMNEIKKAITPKTKVIMPVDIAGFPCDYSELYELIKSDDVVNIFFANSLEQKQLGRILILEDAAHSFGAFYKNRPIGSVSDITVFSFHAVKNLTTAEGGAVCFNLPSPFNNKEIYDYFNILCLHGQNKDALSKMKKGNWKYDVILPGYKANMTDILASIGLVEISRYREDTLPKRKNIFEYYADFFSKYTWAELPIFETQNKVSSYHLFLLRIRNIDESKRDKIIQSIFDKNVSVNVHFQPLPLFSYYKSLGYSIDSYPVSYLNYSALISLPVYYDLTNDNLNQIVSAVVKSVEEVL